MVTGYIASFVLDKTPGMIAKRVTRQIDPDRSFKHRVAHDAISLGVKHGVGLLLAPIFA